jgi:2-polyprenyl-6-methoxyphenol hydroxylase-like FAD-dependent oxidoreductase
MMTRMVPVLVVGAGPVGLTLAGDLAWRGIPSLLVERSDGTIEQPRMDMVGIRTMEFARRWGIVADVEASPYPRDYPQDNVYLTSMTGWELGRERFPAMAEDRPPATSPQKRERCPQDMFDPILRRWVERQGHTEMRYGCELIGLRQEADHVVAEVVDRASGRRQQIAARYAVGCDGAGSLVRELVGIPMHGTPVLTNTTNLIFRDRDLVSRHDKGRAYRHIFIGPEGTWATIVAINGADRWRMSIIQTPPGGLAREEIENAIRRAVGADFPFEILSVAHWTRRELVAERYSRGRVFIAGDAAHVMSPTGGFGMNTGIGDAVDLAWKLEALLTGWGGEALAESFTLERRPVAERNVRESSANLARMLSPGLNPALCDDTTEGEATRKRVGAEFAAAMRHEWYTLGIHLGYRYDGSPIVWDDDAEAPLLEVARYTPTTVPGARAPHVWLSDERSTLDLFGRGFVLVRSTPDVDTSALEDAAAECGVPLRVETIGEPAVRDTYERDLVLVRPDGHVAWRGDEVPADPQAVLDRIRGASARAAAAR